MVANMKITPVTEEMLNEQIERENERDAVNGNQEDGADGADDGDQGVDRGQDDGGEPQRQERAKPVAMSPQDEKREAMANRFRRPGADVPFDGDMTRLENQYGDVAAEQLEVDPDAPEPGVPADQQTRQQDQQQPRMITRKVRGVDVTKSEDEWLELASKVAAGDSYLEESRALLEDAKRIKAERAGQSDQHPDRQTSTEDGQDDDGHSRQTRHPGTDLKSVVEKIQFGDPEEAARELETAINTAADKRANEGHIQRLVANDLARSKAALKAFTESNAEIAADPIASNLVENLVYQTYREEIKALGIDEAQIPKDPKALADWHRLYRVHGSAVSSPADVLTKAKAKFEEWRGTSQQTKPQPRKEAPRVAVNVDRTERRMQIPVQPARAVVPRRDAPKEVQSNSRKDAVLEMRRSRGQHVE